MDRFLIFIFAGEKTYLLGKHGEYVSSLADAMKFEEALDAMIYVDRHGIEKITSVRKVQIQAGRN